MKRSELQQHAREMAELHTRQQVGRLQLGEGVSIGTRGGWRGGGGSIAWDVTAEIGGKEKPFTLVESGSGELVLAEGQAGIAPRRSNQSDRFDERLGIDENLKRSLTGLDSPDGTLRIERALEQLLGKEVPRPRVHFGVARTVESERGTAEKRQGSVTIDGKQQPFFAIEANGQTRVYPGGLDPEPNKLHARLDARLKARDRAAARKRQHGTWPERRVKPALKIPGMASTKSSGRRR